jgi:5-(carboxyamino)imidazole ribonucleotide synthase
MVNIMGEDWNFGTPDWTAILKIPGCHLHLYGKKEAKKGRKMGHVTVTGDPDAVRERIQNPQKKSLASPGRRCPRGNARWSVG